MSAAHLLGGMGERKPTPANSTRLSCPNGAPHHQSTTPVPTIDIQAHPLVVGRPGLLRPLCGGAPRDLLRYGRHDKRVGCSGSNVLSWSATPTVHRSPASHRHGHIAQIMELKPHCIPKAQPPSGYCNSAENGKRAINTWVQCNDIPGIT